MTWLRIVAMPLHFASLSFVVLVTVIVVLALRNIPSNIVIAILLLFLSLSWLNKYAFALLDAAANGRREAPVVSVEMLGPFNDMRVWAHPALLLVAAAIAWKLGSPGGPILFAVLVLLLPASIAATAMSGFLTDAVNPVAIASAVRGLGPFYPLALLAGTLPALAVWALMRGTLPVPVTAALGCLCRPRVVCADRRLRVPSPVRARFHAHRRPGGQGAPGGARAPASPPSRGRRVLRRDPRARNGARDECPGRVARTGHALAARHRRRLLRGPGRGMARAEGPGHAVARHHRVRASRPSSRRSR